MRKGQKKKDGKQRPVQIRFSKKQHAVIKYLADLYTGGNTTAWITIRATTRTDRESARAHKDWKTHEEALARRRLERRGIVLPERESALKRKSGDTRKKTSSRAEAGL